MARSSASPAGRSFESWAHTFSRDGVASASCQPAVTTPKRLAAASKRLHITALPTDDGRFVLKETGQVVGRAELVLLGLRQLVARRPRSAPW